MTRFVLVKKLLVVTLLPMTLIGCPSTGGTRPCGSFDHPEGAEWLTVADVGETAIYRDASGENLVLTLLSRELNAPYTGYDRFGSEEVNCKKTLTSRYMLDDQQAGLVIELRQIEGFERPFEEQVFSLGVSPEAPVGTDLEYGFGISLSNALSDYGGDGFLDSASLKLTRAMTDVEIGEARYALAVESVYTNSEFVLDLVPENSLAISGVAFGKGGGLVRVDTADGRRFVRVGLP